jgi:hypothetical protein
MIGYDTFFLEPDTVEGMRCKVCSAQCEVERSLTGPTGSAEASAGRGHWHDEFSCPYRGKPWHEQALRLVLEIERTPSKRLAELMRLDLDELLHENGL